MSLRLLHIGAPAHVSATVPGHALTEIRLNGETPHLAAAVDALPFPSQSLDAAVSHPVTVTEPRFAVRELYRVLKVGGSVDLDGDWPMDAAPWRQVGTVEGRTVATR